MRTMREHMMDILLYYKIVICFSISFLLFPKRNFFSDNLLKHDNNTNTNNSYVLSIKMYRIRV